MNSKTRPGIAPGSSSGAKTPKEETRSGRKLKPEASPQVPSGIPIESPDPAIVLDTKGRVLGANGAAKRGWAIRPTHEPKPPAILLPFWTDDEGRAALLAGARTAEGLDNLEVRLPGTEDEGDQVYWIKTQRISHHERDFFVAVARDVTKKSSELELLRICYDDLAARSDRDPITGFYNREQFHLLLERELERSGRDGRSMGLLYFDLDDFKTLNDTHGLAAGDEYLTRLGDALRSARRAGELIGRVGGDEIAIVLPGASAAEAPVEAERLQQLFAQLTPAYEGQVLRLTASIGFAVFPDHGRNAADLLHAADLAMHQARRRGRSRYRVHDPEEAERDKKGSLRGQADRIRSAIEEKRLVPVFQPVSDVKTRKTVAVETLVRLREPNGRLASPAEFLDAAERFGFMTEIDRLVITSAFDAIAVAHRGRSPDLEMAINLSGHDFEDDALVGDISRMARMKGVRPDKITFEITETAALRDMTRVQNFTRALVAEGFRFALDDFGIGYSSFRYLRELPVSALKFDISYIQNLASQPENRVFVRGITEICRGLHVKTVAEGVESEPIFTILRELGVDRAQGHHIGLPVPELPIGVGRSGSGVFRALGAT
ncbi:MAG TPA: EAL domain-containing protein [Thermoanaerobaculia bacterium]|nr:EAL domain-containing protein [Thermoanaerobaculia bacterium]